MCGNEYCCNEFHALPQWMLQRDIFFSFFIENVQFGCTSEKYQDFCGVWHLTCFFIISSFMIKLAYSRQWNSSELLYLRVPWIQSPFSYLTTFRGSKILQTWAACHAFYLNTSIKKKKKKWVFFFFFFCKKALSWKEQEKYFYISKVTEKLSWLYFFLSSFWHIFFHWRSNNMISLLSFLLLPNTS